MSFWLAGLVAAMVLIGRGAGTLISLVAFRLPKAIEKNYRRLATQTLNEATQTSRCSSDSCTGSRGSLLSLYRNRKTLCSGCQAALQRTCYWPEAAAVAILLLSFWLLPPLQALLTALAGWWLLLAALIDFDHQWLPDLLTLPLLWFGLIVNTLGLFCEPAEAILGATLGYLMLWLVLQGFYRIAGKPGLGYGDLKLFAAAGAWAGWPALPNILLLAAAGGLCCAGYLFLKGRFRPSEPLAFGPWIGLAFWSHLVIENL